LEFFVDDIHVGSSAENIPEFFTLVYLFSEKKPASTQLNYEIISVLFRK
jgi:hypothetical protein